MEEMIGRFAHLYYDDDSVIQSAVKAFHEVSLSLGQWILCLHRNGIIHAHLSPDIIEVDCDLNECYVMDATQCMRGATHIRGSDSEWTAPELKGKNVRLIIHACFGVLIICCLG